MPLRNNQKLRLTASGEVEVVVWTWRDEHGDADAYVAFFGEAFPDWALAERPYVPRYYESSLEVLE
jgi:hypothetical protein